MERMDFTASINHSVRRRKFTDGKCIPQSMSEQNGITSFPKSKKTVGMTGEPIRTKRKHAQTWKFSMGEFLNLTYLDSVRLRYVIANRKVTSWRIGGCDVDYAAALRYLNKALEYLDEREKKEKEMLLKYMDKLPENWQVDLTLWRKEHGYHALTEARAKKMGVGKKIEGKKRAEVSQWRESNPI